MSMYDPYDGYDSNYDQHEQIRAEIAQLEQQVLADQEERWQAQQAREAEALIENVEAQLEVLGVKSERDRELIVSQAIATAQAQGAQTLDLAAAHLMVYDSKMDAQPPPPETPLPDNANSSERTQWMTERLAQLRQHDEDMTPARQYLSPEGPPLDAGAQDRVEWMTGQLGGEAA